MSSYKYSQDGDLESFQRSLCQSKAQSFNAFDMQTAGVLLEFAYGQEFPIVVPRRNLIDKGLCEEKILELVDAGYLEQIDDNSFGIQESVVNLGVHKVVAPLSEPIIEGFNNQVHPIRSERIIDEG